MLVISYPRPFLDAVTLTSALKIDFELSPIKPDVAQVDVWPNIVLFATKKTSATNLCCRKRPPLHWVEPLASGDANLRLFKRQHPQRFPVDHRLQC
jgi:hypothetical protein